MITFNDGKQLNTIAVYGGTETYQSAQRKTLEFVVAADELTLDEAKAIWQGSNATSEITVEDNGESSVQLNFTLPVSLTLSQMDGVDVIRMKLAQKSALELMQEKQAQDMDDVNAALCELAEIVAGGDE
nr:MAG TPA: hypothetical protein [Caudoviricetes sp.]